LRERATVSPRAWQATVDTVVDDVEDEVVEIFFFRVVWAVKRYAVVVEIFSFELSEQSSRNIFALNCPCGCCNSPAQTASD
jgi:hypothetical protein